MLDWLSRRPSVKWISPVLHSKLHNLPGGVITQTGGLDLSTAVSSPSQHPLWAAGLDGTGQLVGLGDSGIDMDSCYFFDPNVDFKGGLDSRSGLSLFRNSNHRKVVSYVGLQVGGWVE